LKSSEELILDVEPSHICYDPKIIVFNNSCARVSKETRTHKP
jgi:hypothetical protein